MANKQPLNWKKCLISFIKNFIVYYTFKHQKCVTAFDAVPLGIQVNQTIPKDEIRLVDGRTCNLTFSTDININEMIVPFTQHATSSNMRVGQLAAQFNI